MNTAKRVPKLPAEVHNRAIANEIRKTTEAAESRSPDFLGLLAALGRACLLSFDIAIIAAMMIRRLPDEPNGLSFRIIPDSSSL